MKMYLVSYCGGDYEDSYVRNLFVTSNKQTAILYVERFNKILNKWKAFYKQFDTRYKYGLFSIQYEEYLKEFIFLNRLSGLERITKCYYDEISIR